MTDRYTIGVDLGGTNLRVAAYAAGNSLLETISLPTRVEKGPDRVMDDMCAAIRELEKRHADGREFAGIGVGTPGPLELPEGKLHSLPNFPGWDGYPMLASLEGRLGQRVHLESDANVAALAEYHLGSGRSYGAASLCMLTLGTGVGNGIILNGHIWDGNNGMGGEAGHNTVYPEGIHCPCGNRGCLEQYASATALIHAAKIRYTGKRDPVPTSAAEIANLAREGDQDALEIFDGAGRALGISLATLINTLNLPLYVVGGGVAGAWDLFETAMMEEVHSRSYVFRFTEPSEEERRQRSPRKTSIVHAELGSEAGILGACLLPLVANGVAKSLGTIHSCAAPA
jgi:glucokinase